MRRRLLYLGAITLLVACAGPGPEEKAAYERLPAVEERITESSLGVSFYGVTLKTRPWVRQEFSGTIPANAKAVVLWLSGGEGFGQPMVGSELQVHGIGVLNVLPPSDRPRGFICCDSPFRGSADHAADIEAVIRYVRAKTGAAIWLAGHSMGTVSSANVATRRPELVDGVILLSSITSNTERGRPARGEPFVTQMDLAKIRSPLLAIAHAQDRDPTTPPRGAEEIVRRASGAPVKEAQMIVASAGAPPTADFHAFADSRFELANRVVKFILANTRERAS